MKIEMVDPADVPGWRAAGRAPGFVDPEIAMQLDITYTTEKYIKVSGTAEEVHGVITQSDRYARQVSAIKEKKIMLSKRISEKDSRGKPVTVYIRLVDGAPYNTSARKPYTRQMNTRVSSGKQPQWREMTRQWVRSDDEMKDLVKQLTSKARANGRVVKKERLPGIDGGWVVIVEEPANG
jgi:hypothetical protein